jgi:hypothetical protein
MQLIKLFLVLISLTFFKGSGAFVYSRLIVVSDLEPLAVRYMEACTSAGRKCAERLDSQFLYLKVTWASSLPNGFIGLCEGWKKKTGDFYGTVYISTSLRKADPEFLYLVLAHEMEHCLRRVDHSPEGQDTLMSVRMMTLDQVNKKFGSADGAVSSSLISNNPDQW